MEVDIAPVLDRKEEKWGTVAELQHMTIVYIQSVQVFLRWRRGRSDTSGYRKIGFVSIILIVRHDCCISYMLVIPILGGVPTA